MYSWYRIQFNWHFGHYWKYDLLIYTNWKKTYIHIIIYIYNSLDKMCDQISDAILDAHLKQDPDAKVACETVTKTGMIMVCGEITSKVINYYFILSFHCRLLTQFCIFRPTLTTRRLWGTPSSISATMTAAKVGRCRIFRKRGSCRMEVGGCGRVLSTDSIPRLWL